MKWKEGNNCLSDEMLQYFFDGELAQNLFQIVEKHLLECEFCKLRFQEKKTLIELLTAQMPNLSDDEIKIPDFHAPNIQKSGMRTISKKYWWAAAAAVFVLFTIGIFNKSDNGGYETEYVFQEMYIEIDANKPWYEQQTTIYILNESGEIIDKIENL